MAEFTAIQAEEAAIAHAKKILGEEQYEKNKVAANSIMTDFKAGIEWTLTHIYKM